MTDKPRGLRQQRPAARQQSGGRRQQGDRQRGGQPVADEVEGHTRPEADPQNQSAQQALGRHEPGDRLSHRRLRDLQPAEDARPAAERDGV